MIETYREKPLDYEKVVENIVNGIKNYVDGNDLKCVVLGLSGGIDSTVCAALCKLANVPLIGISLPCSTNKADEKSAATVAGEEFCDAFKEVNLENMSHAIKNFCDHRISKKESTPISQGNIKARLRMLVLYDIASKSNGIVIDTDNLTEHFLGFFTLHGDQGDLNPIGGLWKHEVYELARYLKKEVYKESKALEQSIALIPTDGNGVKEGGDLAQIAPNKTYDDVDEILTSWVGIDERIKKKIIELDFDYGVFKYLNEKHGKDIVKMVIMRCVNSEFKRKQAPFVIDIYRGLVCEKNGNIFV